MYLPTTCSIPHRPKVIHIQAELAPVAVGRAFEAHVLQEVGHPGQFYRLVSRARVGEETDSGRPNPRNFLENECLPVAQRVWKTT